MSSSTYNRRLEQLIVSIMHHTHKSELTALMQEQQDDDRFSVDQQLIPIS
jgi:hypothetical protein